MIGYDIDGVLTNGYQPSPGDVVISGRTFREYDATAKRAAQICPVYIRGVGKFGDDNHAAKFKAAMIKELGVTKFYEDSPTQIQVIRELCPDCEIVYVTKGPQ
jgi:hypothetical protein